MNMMQCKTCESMFEVDPDDVGHKIACPTCHTVVRHEVPKQGVATLKPRMRMSDEFTDLEREWVRAEARGSVKNPSRLLGQIAMIGLFISMLLTAVIIFIGLVVILTADRVDPDDYDIFLWVGLATIFIPYFFLIYYSSIRLRKLDSLGWGYTGACLAIIPALMMGAYSLIGIPMALIGLITLIALAKWEVRMVIRWNQEKALD